MPTDHSQQPEADFEIDGPGRSEATPLKPDELLSRLSDPMYRAWLEEALDDMTFPADGQDMREGEEGAA